MATPKLTNCNTEQSLSVDYSSLESLEKDIRETRESLEAEGWTNLSVRMICYWSDTERPYIFGDRMETIEEAEKREAEEAKREEEREERERREFARLQAKFAGEQ